MALSGHTNGAERCPLVGVKRTHVDVSVPAALQKGSSLVANGAFSL
jgi:hypothetical protein